ncbi:alpha/beta hydrolase [Microvirga sp. BT291]|nr:alpha/beta hydrolase [Microvirga pudoricolor]
MGKAQFMDAGGIKTRYFERGSGPCVVLLHGGHMGSPTEVQTASVWSTIFDRLGDGIRVIAIDRLGQGYTDNPKAADDYTLDASAAHVAAVLREFGNGPYHLVGHDEGAFVAAQISVEHPGLVASLVLVSANTLTPGVDRRNIVQANPPVPLMSRQSLRWMFETASPSHLSVTEEWLDEPVDVAKSDRNVEAVEVMQADDRYLRSYVGSWNRRRSELHRFIHANGLPCPTLVVWGLDDPIAPFSNAEYLMELLAPKQRETELRVFNRSGYYVFREHPNAFCRTVRSFVESHTNA